MCKRRDCQAGWRPERRDDPVPQRQIRLAARVGEFIQDQRGLGQGQRQQDRRAPRLGKDSDKIKGAFAIARDLAEKVVAEKKRKKAAAAS